MAIVHPAFCVVDEVSTEPFAKPALSISLMVFADTKHFKNRVYSSGTADVLSASDIATRQ